MGCAYSSGFSLLGSGPKPFHFLHRNRYSGLSLGLSLVEAAQKSGVGSFIIRRLTCMDNYGLELFLPFMMFCILLIAHRKVVINFDFTA